eukprot:6513731-Prymnesium_polylepis.1
MPILARVNCTVTSEGGSDTNICGRIHRPITPTGAPGRTDEARFWPDKLVRAAADDKARTRSPWRLGLRARTAW